MTDAPASLGLRERKKRRSRESILAAAMALFRERGYDAVTVEEVASAADISTRTFYYYFPTKVDLVLQFHARALHELVETILNAPRGASATDIVAGALREGIDDEHQSLIATRFEIMNQSPALQNKLRDRRAIWAQEIAHALIERDHFDRDESLAYLFGRCLVSATETALEAYVRDPAGGDVALRLQRMFEVVAVGFATIDRTASTMSATPGT